MKIGYSINLAVPHECDITREEVEQMIAASEEKMDQRIVDYSQAAIETGSADDIRPYESREAFPEVGTPGVQYVALDTKTEWQWIVDDEELGTGHYTEINETTSEEDIEKIFE